VLRVEAPARQAAEDRLLEALIPAPTTQPDEERDSLQATREKFRQKLRAGELEERSVELRISESPLSQVNVFSSEGMEQMGIDLGMLSDFMPQRTVTKRLSVREARQLLFKQEAEKLINQEEIRSRGLRRAEEMGIIFLDEIDKIGAGGRVERGGPGVSRQGVQRDLLPLLEGATVRTRYGNVSTENILFIAAGAFNMSKPSDLIPELQGRLPIRVELRSLGEADFRRILTEPKDALVKQYQALLAVENLQLEFSEQALNEIAHIAYQLNRSMEDIGARRLQTVMERLMEDLLFETTELPRRERFKINADYVRSKLSQIAEDLDLSRYIL